MDSNNTIMVIIISFILGLLSSFLINNKNIKKVLSSIVYIIYILILIIVIQRITFKDNRVLNYYVYKIASGSMAETLHVDDYIIIKKSNYYNVGDIITYQIDDKTITHRIVQINGDEIITKGDVNFNVDKAISKNQVIGKVIFHGQFINILVTYGAYMIVVYTTTYIVIDILLKKRKNQYLQNY